jgi:predicted ATP-dependent endonuclease of OLD family
MAIAADGYEMSAPIIYYLAIQRFRCLDTFSWHPTEGVNVILGGGDVGKTAILDATGLLLSPTNPATLPDTDYHGRVIEAGFFIDAIVSTTSIESRQFVRLLVRPGRASQSEPLQ